MELNSSMSAVITGGSSGLGAATARALASKGVKVALFDLNVEAGESLAAELGGIFCAVDVTSQDACEAGFAFKTAGRDKKTGAIKTFPMDKFELIVQINLLGTFRCIALSAAGMMTLDPCDDHGERGAIVNTASVAAQDGQMGQASYAASKAGVVGMTLPIARDLMSEGIRINTIMPGIFDTPLLQSAPDNVKEALASSVPFPKRLGVPPEFAHLAVAMVENGYFNGESVRLDGAIRMAPR